LETAYPSSTTNSYSTMWPSSMTFPDTGCWQVQLEAQDEKGALVSGSATFIVVP
jgi:hypothetical protein